MLSISTKAQAWYMDFAIALLLFIFTLVVYFSYTTNFQKQDEGDLDVVLKDAKSISSSLALNGYPNDWKNETVIRIGVSDEQRLNATKVTNFKVIDYNRTRRIFATPYDYFVFFTNDKGEVLNINGVCGIGHPIISTTYIVKSAYYYSDDDDDFLKDFMNETFNADIYKDNIDSLVSNLSKYGLLMMEHPLLATSAYNQYKDELENYSSNGGILMISGELTTAQGKELVGADFYKKSGQSISDRNSTVNNTDQYLSLTIGENIVFRQAYYVENTSSAINFKQIATFNQDNKNSISKWGYGNGTVYFFSDFDVSYFNGDFAKIVEDATKALIEGTCTPINITNISPKNLVKIERYLTYNSKVVKMVLYLWQ